MDVRLHGGVDVVVLVHHVRHAVRTHLDVGHVAAHEVEVADVLRGRVVAAEVVPDCAPGPLEVDLPVRVVIE